MELLKQRIFRFQKKVTFLKNKTMKNLIIYTFIISTVFACKKFDHQEKKFTQPCEFCEVADSLQGTYTGRLIKKSFKNITAQGYTFDTILDTVINMEVIRTYDGLNHLEDSIVFKFNTSYFFDEIYFSEQSIHERTFYPEKYYNQSITEDDTIIIKSRRVISNKIQNISYYSLEFKGGKEP